MKPLTVLFLMVCLVGCAGGATDPAGEAPEPEPTPDPMPEPMPDPMPEPMPDMMPEPEPDPCPVCCAGERRCRDEGTSEVCRMEGTGFDVGETCPEGEICQEGRCDEPPFMCNPGETTCLDLETQQTCNVDGMGVTTLRCQESVCIGGQCSMGALTGEACEFEEDCAGGACLCDSTEACPVALEGAIGEGYCTMADCAVTGCPDDELCVDFSRFSNISEGRHCFKDCEVCDRAGFTCRDVPTHTEESRIVWQGACFTDFPRDMGSECTQDSDCIGGTCWTGDLGPNDDLGYCTMAACGERADCPSGSSCVEFPGLGFFCGQHCGTGAPGSGGCPVNRGLSTFCQTLAEFGTNSIKSICGPRRMRP